MILTGGKPDHTDANCYERFTLKFRMKAWSEASKKGTLQNINDWAIEFHRTASYAKTKWRLGLRIEPR
jgi:hypothetical protein